MKILFEKNIGQALASGYPEPIISGNSKGINGKKAYHETSKKAFNVFCATRQRRNHHMHLLKARTEQKNE